MHTQRFSNPMHSLPRRSLCTVLVCALASCGNETIGAEAELGASGFSRGRSLGALNPGRLLALPLTSRSHIVPRGEVQEAKNHAGDGPGASIRVWAPGSTGGSARTLVVSHTVDEQVLVSNQGWYQVSAPILPRSIEPRASTLLARQDGSCAEGTLLVTAPPSSPGATSWLVILSGAEREQTVQVAGQEYRLPAAPRGALVMPWAGTPTIELQTTGPIDQVYFCSQAQEVGQLIPWQALSFETGHLDVPVALLEDQENQSMTLLVEIIEAPKITSPGVTEANAPLPEALRDVAAEAGIRMVHLEGPALQLDIRPTMGPGAAWGDFDGDGWVDLFLPQGAGRPEQDPLPHRLFRNQGDGTFEDISSVAGLGGGDASMGALAFDADGDGQLDLYLACQGADRFFLGNGNGTFRDASDLLPPTDLWSASVSAADYDQDGDLDLYVTRYLEYDPRLLPPESEAGGMRREDPLPMLPYLFPGQPNQLLRNDLKDGTLGFSDVAVELGVHDPKTRRVGEEEQDAPGLGMQAIWWDFDRDGDQDLYVANDVTPNVLYENTAGAFQEVTLEAGLDDPRGGMGLAIGDLERDGDEALVLSNWELDSNALYLNLLERRFSGRSRRPRFRDAAIAQGFARPSLGVTSWGPVLFDLELDGDLDVFVANGYTSPDYASTGICLGQPDHLFLNQGTAFVEASLTHMENEPFPCASRGAIACDYDQDGDEDLLVTANNGAVRLLRNDSPRAAGHTSIRIRLAGGGANPRGIGAEVTLFTPGGEFRRSLRAGEGYLTGGPGELLFGLGACKESIRATVRWPSGQQTEHSGLKPGGLEILKEN